MENIFEFMVWKKIGILKEISYLGIANIIPSIISAGFWFYIASLVGEKTYGEINYYLAIAGLGSVITMLGAPSALTVYSAKGERIIQTIAVIIFPLSIIAALVIFFIFNNLGASIHVFTYIIFLLISAEFLGRKLFKEYMIIQIIQKSLMVFLSILFYYIVGNDGIILGIAISFSPFIILYIKEFREYKINFSKLRGKKKFFVNNYLLQLTRTFSSSIDKILIVPIFGFAFLGNYALGIQFYTVFLIFPSIIYQYILPQDASGNPNIFLKKITVLISICIAVLGVIIAPIIIKILFSEFEEASLIVQIMIIGVIPSTINYLYISKFLGRLENKIILVGSSIFLVSISLGVVSLGTIYDIYGVAIAFVLANTIESVFLITVDRFIKIKK